jgi:hypothetical protein
VAKYKVLLGINYPDGKGGELRAEPGDVVSDLPDKTAKWMERDGVISSDLKAPLPSETDEEEEA